MKIAIVTYYKVPGYGAMLQAYALQSYLQQRGHDVEFLKTTYLNIQKNRKSIRDYFSFSLHGTLVKWQNKFWERSFLRSKFSERLIETQKEYSSLDELQHNPPEADLYLVGSDQMWSPVLFWEEREQEKLRTVLLDFGKTGVIKASYAPSFGSPDWYREDLMPIFSDGIGQLDKISVREASGRNIVQRVSPKEVFWVMDPTLLHDARFYLSLVDSDHLPENPYLFKFLLSSPGQENRLCEMILSRYKLCSVVTPKDRPKNRLLDAANFTVPVEVEFWVSSIYKAGFVLTDSYHGLAFSLIFHRPFFVLLQDGAHARRNDRILSLLDRLGLESRSCKVGEAMNTMATPLLEINWDEVEQKLKPWREESNDFFQSLELMSDARKV